MKAIIAFILLSVAVPAWSQDWPLRSLVLQRKSEKVAFTSMPAFRYAGSKSLPNRGEYQLLKLNSAFIPELLKRQPEALLINIPLDKNRQVSCELLQYSLGNIKLTENAGNTLEGIQIPLTYRGIINGEEQKNSVILTVNGEYLSLVVTSPGMVLQITRDENTPPGNYRLYNSKKVQFPHVPVDCGTPEKNISRSSNGIDITGVPHTVTAVQDKCVNVFVDCFDSLFINRGSSRQRTVSYVYELFNMVATGFYNDSINIQITAINVWTTMDPYRGDNRTNALNDLAAFWQDNFWGNICVGLDFSTTRAGRSGLAGDIGRIKAVSANTCPAYTSSANACCYNDMNYTVSVQNFPVGPNTTGSQVYLVIHEIGHLLGANHTKWCGWKLTSNPDTYGAIDSCGTIEGSCMQGPPPPPNGATMMSYCVTGNAASDFVNYNNGFGTLPGNAIRSFVAGSSCLLNCSDCFGSILPQQRISCPAVNPHLPGGNRLIMVQPEGMLPGTGKK